MLHHRTTDTAKRAEHIADRLETLREREAISEFWNGYDLSTGDFGPSPYLGWPRYWLDVYGEAVRELQECDETKE